MERPANGKGAIVRMLAVLGATTAVSVATAGGAAAYTQQELYSFTGGTDGSGPQAALIGDAAGNLYGTAYTGGLNSAGTVFELVRPHDGRPWRLTPLYNFCAQAGCIDGQQPQIPLILDTAGRLYGTTSAGGSYTHGVAFMLTPDAKRKHWSIKVIYNFCSRDSLCSDGNRPSSGLTYQGAESGAPYDGVSPLYGVTLLGGRRGLGVAYALTLNSRGAWREKNIYMFCRVANCADGSKPSGDPTMDAAGHLYGAASAGGNAAVNGAGTIFKLSPPASGHVWSETVLYTFCQAANCADGSTPNGALTFDGAGNIFGTTSRGGTQGGGTVFQLAPGGGETVLYRFCTQTDCTDGSNPLAGVTMDASGNLFGTTIFGGANSKGVAFEVSGSSFGKLHDFCSQANCTDGSTPFAGLLIDPAGDLFGTTTGGGDHGIGTVYELTP
jgi:uncharacterized repeat protein (TIGR03803 family)